MPSAVLGCGCLWPSAELNPNHSELDEAFLRERREKERKREREREREKVRKQESK